MPSASPPRRFRSVSVAAVLLVAAVVCCPSPAVPAERPASHRLKGTGAWTSASEVGGWTSVLAAGPSPATLDYVPKGSGAARDAFVRGEADFVVSGAGFTRAEEAALAESGRGYAAIPLRAEALVLLLHAPAGGLRVAGAPRAEDGAQPYTGPLRMPATTLARSFLGEGETWGDPDLAEALGVRLRPIASGVDPVVRSDASAENLRLAGYLRAAAPDVWKAGLDGASVAADGPSESWPTPSTAAREGEPGVVDAVVSDDRPSGGPSRGGTIGAVDLRAAREAMAAFPSRDLRVVQLRNAAGEWVEPTPASVSAALVAGDGRPSDDPGDPVPGAYPLSRVDILYVPATGLDPWKLDALTTLVRHAVTAGRAEAVARGDAELPGVLVTRALEAADALVAANCTGPEATVVRVPVPDATAAGWPGPDVQGPPRMSTCRRAGAPAPGQAEGTKPPAPLAAVGPPVDTRDAAARTGVPAAPDPQRSGAAAQAAGSNTGAAPVTAGSGAAESPPAFGPGDGGAGEPSAGPDLLASASGPPPGTAILPFDDLVQVAPPAPDAAAPRSAPTEAAVAAPAHSVSSPAGHSSGHAPALLAVAVAVAWAARPAPRGLRRARGGGYRRRRRRKASRG